MALADEQLLVDALLAVDRDGIAQLMRGEAELKEHVGLPLDLVALLQHDPRLAAAVIAEPDRALKQLDKALVAAQVRLHDTAGGADQQLYVRENAHVRPHSLPYALDPDAGGPLNPGIGGVGSAHLGRLVTVRGTVLKAGPVRMFEASRRFMCRRCRHVFSLNNANEPSAGTTHYDLPPECPSNHGGNGGGNGRPCLGSAFVPLDAETNPDAVGFTNHQELRVQEPLQLLEPGSVPASIVVTAQDELADSAQPGDDVEVTGVVRAVWRPLFPGGRCDGTLTIAAARVRALSSLHRAAAGPPAGLAEEFSAFWAHHRHSPLQGRNKILASVCPQIYGLYLVKLCVALTLIGGCARRDDSGAHVRGEPHMLLVGDPGTGKSQVMKFAARMAPRAVVTTGRGTTGAGLTVAASKEGGAWSLEAGALVLADGGLCCIDEFEAIREQDRAMIHEAMEQQTLHVAKAGMVTTLSTRTSVLGVTNPSKGAFKHGSGPGGSGGGVAATSLSAPLLSRFDIVLLLLDQHEPTWDAIVSEHVLRHHQHAGRTLGRGDADFYDGGARSSGWTTEDLRAYVAWAKARAPSLAMSPAAERLLLAYYQGQRRAEERSQARTTIRMLESLVRVSQAHARLCARDAVSLQDAVVAVLVLDSSMTGSSLLGWSNALHTHFPDDADAECARLERQVLAALGLHELGAGGGGAAGESSVGGNDGGGGGGVEQEQEQELLGGGDAEDEPPPWQQWPPPPQGREREGGGGGGTAPWGR